MTSMRDPTRKGYLLQGPTGSGVSSQGWVEKTQDPKASGPGGVCPFRAALREEDWPVSSPETRPFLVCVCGGGGARQPERRRKGPEIAAD